MHFSPREARDSLVGMASHTTGEMTRQEKSQKWPAATGTPNSFAFVPLHRFTLAPRCAFRKQLFLLRCCASFFFYSHARTSCSRYHCDDFIVREHFSASELAPRTMSWRRSVYKMRNQHVLRRIRFRRSAICVHKSAREQWRIPRGQRHNNRTWCWSRNRIRYVRPTVGQACRLSGAFAHGRIPPD